MDKTINSLIESLKFEKKHYRNNIVLNEDLVKGRSSYEDFIKSVMDCRKCELHQGIANKVAGDGELNSRIMVIGEAPGADEDRLGKPFVGKAGEKLMQMLLYIGLKREDVYIANVLKCRPPLNADPTAEQVKSCIPFLNMQIETVNPAVILTLGRFAVKALLSGESSRMQDYLNKSHATAKGIPVIATYHPAALLHGKGEKLNEMRRQVAQDLDKLKEMMEKI